MTTSTKYPDPANIFEAMEVRHQRQSLEHSLATNFIALQKTNVPAERQRIWAECLRLAKEIERLNEHD